MRKAHDADEIARADVLRRQPRKQVEVFGACALNQHQVEITAEFRVELVAIGEIEAQRIDDRVDVSFKINSK